MRRLALAISFLGLAACGKNVGGGGGGGQGQPDSASGTPDVPPLQGTKYSLQWGPVTVPADTEDTQCVILKLSNVDAIKVHQLHNVLGTGSHHMIIYKDDMDTIEQPVPQDCQPFTGALNTSGMVAPLMITQKSDDELTLPDGVAYTLNANQMVRIELHYINATDSPISLMATADFYAADPSTINNEAAILFIGSPDISLPPNTMTTLHEFFTPSKANLDLSSAKFFAITGHEHHLGLDVKINTSTSITGTMTSIYNPNPFLWSEPVTQTFNPEFTVPTGSGFDFTCTWFNSEASTVQFGESANDEMCFFWAYYYPSKGAHVCIHTSMVGGVDICCPDAGATLCGMLIPNN